MKKIKLAINGKFLTVPSTGVQRVAYEIVYALDALLENDQNLSSKFDIVIIAPKKHVFNLALKKIVLIQKGYFSGCFKNNLWEQFSLPFLTQGRLLVSMCNIAPIFIKNAAVFIHDAQVYTSPHSYSFLFKTWYKFAIPMIGYFARVIITVSDFGKKELVDFNISKKRKIFVSYNGADHILKITTDETILDQFQLKNKLFFVAQSNTQQHKNIIILLKAFADVALEDIVLVLYGSANKNDFEALGYFVPNNIIFTGRVSDEQLCALLKNAVATLTPSTTEGFGLQPLEGMVLGTPAVVSPCGALPEICSTYALYAEPQDSNSWVSNIKLLASEQDVLNEYRKKSLLNAEQFTWEKSAINLLNIIERSDKPINY